MNSIWGEFARIIFHVEVNVEPADFEPEPEPRAAGAPVRRRGPGAAVRAAAGGRAATAAAAAAGVAPAGRSRRARRAMESATARPRDENPATVVKADREKIGRNDPCWCGSGKKYKKCHGA